MIDRRRLVLGSASTLLLSLAPWQIARGARMVDVRMWPAEEYTRVTLEYDSPLNFKYFFVRSSKPLRLVVDIKGLELTVALQKQIAAVMQQYGIAVKESRGQLSYLPTGRTKFIRAKHLGDKFDKAEVLAALNANAERKPKAQFKQDTIGKLIDIQSRMTEGKGIGYKRWLTKHNLKVMAQTVKLLQEKGLTDEDALNQRIAELETKYHDTLAVVKDLEGRMKANKELRYHIAAYTSTKNVAQQLKTAKRPAVFEEQHRAELTAYRVAAAYFKANNTTKLPSPKKLEAEYAQLASEKAKFYEQYKEAKEELLKLKTAKQNVASFFREEEQAQQER